jgi:hypothetical protein
MILKRHCAMVEQHVALNLLSPKHTWPYVDLYLRYYICDDGGTRTVGDVLIMIPNSLATSDMYTTLIHKIAPLSTTNSGYNSTHVFNAVNGALILELACSLARKYIS